MLEKKVISLESNMGIGIFTVNIKTYHVLFVDEGMKRLYPKMAIGTPCYEGVEETVPCEDCPLRKLESSVIAVGYRPDNDMSIIAIRLDSEGLPYALVCNGQAGLRGEKLWPGKEEGMLLPKSVYEQYEYDDITGIHNKTAFYHETEALLRNRSDLSYNIVLFDIDRFKMVNDLFGTAEGDGLLRFIGNALTLLVRRDETYGRIRDDVFAMCLSRSDADTVEVIGQIEKKLSDYPLAFKLVLSAGIYQVRDHGSNVVNVLCDRASLAKKTVKGNAVMTYAFYKDYMGSRLFREQEIIGEMHGALKNGQFTAFFQPKHEIPGGRIVGAEALVRWEHPEKGLILPGEFIPLFERNGLITLLDEYVWEFVCRSLRDWLDRGLNPPPISINVSRIHLYDPAICDKITTLASNYGIDPHLLEIELTESAYVENPRLGEIMLTLQDKGFTFLMDDFGSGYSSLNMLRNIPVDILKIDLNFLRFSEEETSGKIIMESVIQMARRLGLPVIAEGVETEAQAAFLEQAGCTMTQGYYYSRPMPAAKFEKVLLKNR